MTAVGTDVIQAPFAPPVRGWFTARIGDDPDAPSVGVAGNMSPHRPHEIEQLVRDRTRVAELIGYPVASWHTMRQVHGAHVAVVERVTPVGAMAPMADAMVTDLPHRPLVVHVADCVPILLAGSRDIAVAHAGRKGVEAGVVEAVVACFAQRDNAGVKAVIGPCIGGCCYEVPTELRDVLCAKYPAAFAATTWGTPSLDLAAAVEGVLVSAGIDVERVGNCTRCDPQQRWFSHRSDPNTGRFAGIVVRDEVGVAHDRA